MLSDSWKRAFKIASETIKEILLISKKNMKLLGSFSDFQGQLTFWGPFSIVSFSYTLTLILVTRHPENSCLNYFKVDRTKDSKQNKNQLF